VLKKGKMNIFLTMADSKSFRTLCDSPEIAPPETVEDILGYTPDRVDIFINQKK